MRTQLVNVCNSEWFMSSKPTIYLHIGAGKTGSTTIQVWLKSVEVDLNNAGYVIFDTNFEPGVQNDKLSNQQQYFHKVLMDGHEGVSAFHEKFRQNLAFMSTHGFHSAIISAENLINHWMEAHQWFTPFIHECNWKIIAYVRNQPYYIISAWKEWGYWRQSFDEYLSENIKYNWLIALKSWDDTFGTNNIYLGILDKRCLVNELLHHDFATAINTPHIIANKHDLIYANPSINNRTAQLFSKIRQQYAARNPQAATINETPVSSNDISIQNTQKNYAKLSSLYHFKPLIVGYAPDAGVQEFDSPLSLVNQEILDSIYDLFKESNQNLLMRYRPDVDPEVAFPRIIYNSDIEISEHELVLHGFHLAFESLVSIQKDLNKLQQQFALLHKEYYTSVTHIWNITTLHEQSINHLQTQIDQLNQLLQLRSNKSLRITQTIKQWISRVISKLIS